MTLATDTHSPIHGTGHDGTELLASRRTRSRRRTGILSRHVPSCRIRGMGL